MTSSYVEQYGGIPSSQGMLLWHHYLRWPYSQRDQIGRFLFLFGQFYLFFRQLLLEKVPNIDFDFGLYLKRRIFLLLGPLWLKYGRYFIATTWSHWTLDWLNENTIFLITSWTHNFHKNLDLIVCILKDYCRFILQ